MEELKKPVLSVNQSVGTCLIINKDIRVNDALSLTDDGFKKLRNLAKTLSNVVLPIDLQYYGYMQAHKRIGARKRRLVSDITARIVVQH